MGSGTADGGSFFSSFGSSPVTKKYHGDKIFTCKCCNQTFEDPRLETEIPIKPQGHDTICDVCYNIIQECNELGYVPKKYGGKDPIEELMKLEVNIPTTSLNAVRGCLSNSSSQLFSAYNDTPTTIGFIGIDKNKTTEFSDYEKQQLDAKTIESGTLRRSALLEAGSLIANRFNTEAMVRPPRKKSKILL